MSPRIIEREIAHAGYLTIERLRLRFADGAEAFREVESHGDAAAVLPYDAERRCALVVRLFRAPVLIAAGEIFLEEACAGMIELEDATTAVHREPMKNWRGFALARVHRSGLVKPGVSTERQSLSLRPIAPPTRRARRWREG